MKQGASRDIGLLRLNLGVWIGWMLSAKPRPFNPWGRAIAPTHKRMSATGPVWMGVGETKIPFT